MPQSRLNAALARNLDALMKARGLSNNELGRLAKISGNTVASYRDTSEEAANKVTSTGKPQSAKLAEIERIAEALNVDPLLLLSDAGVEPGTPPHAILSPIEQQMLTVFRLVPPEAQVALLDGQHRIAASALGDKILAEKFGVKSYVPDDRVLDAYYTDLAQDHREHGLQVHLITKHPKKKP